MDQAALGRNSGGRICGYQIITFRDVKGFVASFTMPGTPTFFKKVKREWLKGSLRNILGTKEATDRSERTIRSAIEQIDLFIQCASDNAWSIDQKAGSLTLSLGVGNDEPIELALAWEKAEDLKFEKELAAHARLLNPQLESKFESESIVAKFIAAQKKGKGDRR
jgi:hypothetical protein